MLTLFRSRWLRLVFVLSVILALIGAPALVKPWQFALADPKAPGDLPHKVYLPLISGGGGNYSPALHRDVPTICCVNEPDDAVVSPLNPHDVAVVAANGLWLSRDYGQNSFAFLNFPFPVNYGSCGDSSLAFDSQGRLFWTILGCRNDNNNPPNRIDVALFVARINFNAGTIDPGFPVNTTPGLNAGRDKQWIAADSFSTSPFRDNIYLAYQNLNAGTIEFVRSTDGGLNWSAQTAISGRSGGTECTGDVRFPHDAVAVNGDLYIAWHAFCAGGTSDTSDGTMGVVNVIRSGNGGADLASGSVNQFRVAFPAGTADLIWNLQTDACRSVPGSKSLWAGSAQPFVIPDPARPGNVYVVAADDPDNNLCNNGTPNDPADVFFARSTDNGATWARQKISHAPGPAGPNAPGSFQAFPTGAADQLGNLMVFWYDNRGGQRNTAGDFLLDTYATVSRDGGLTWSNDFRINDTAFDPDAGAGCYGLNCGNLPPNQQTLRIGEYNGAAATDGFAYAAFTGNTVGGNPPAPNGQQIFLDAFSILGAFPDRFEPNDAVNAGVATNLGAPATYHTTGLTIHNANDEDFFKVTALHTGKLTFSIGMNSRLSDLDIQVLDKFNPHIPPNVVATSTPDLDSNDTETIVVPVVAGETYYLRVSAEPGQQPPMNTYDLSVVNTPVPTPLEVALAPGSDSGRSDHDNVTNVANATVRVRVDESTLSGLSVSPPNATATFADDNPGYKVVVYRSGAEAGFATPVAGQPGSFDFTFAGVPLSESLNMITARVFIIDRSDNPDVAGISHAVGQGAESGPLIVTLDTTPPAPPSAPDLLPSSDSGASNSDNVTKVNPPAFQGTGEANDIIRMRANGTLVGEGTVGSDGSNGVLGDGLGAWEVTIEPLADGGYTMTADLEDLAGNFSEPSAAMAPGFVLDTPDGGGMPQRPTLDLIDAFDTGRSNQDNNTYLNTLDFRVSAEPTTTVAIKDGNTVIQTFVMPPTDFTTRTLVLSEGPHPLSTESTDLAGNTSHQSEQLLVTVDTTAPITPTAPDLLGSSDSGGISIDNITTVDAPTFGGSGEPNTLVKVYANGALVGEGLMNSLGAYQVQIEPLADGVYNITTTYEDLAGNVSAPSAPLKVTIAKYILNLPGATTSPASGDVTVDLNSGTIVGYPGVPGGTIGIAGIPTVNLDVSGHALTIFGTSGDDSIAYSPTGPQAGSVSRAGSNQVLNFTNAAGTFTIDPGAGNDTVTTNGTPSSDVVTMTVTTNSLVAINDLKMLSIPTINTEKIAVASGQSVDIISVNVYDTVDANVFVDAGQPTNVSQVQDELNTYDRVGNAQIKNLSSGPVPGSGSVTFDFVRTTGRQTRIDYVDVEKFRIFR